MKQNKINEEIKELKQRLNELEDIHPNYISEELKELQNKVLITHAHLENALNNIILIETIGLINNLKEISEKRWFQIIIKFSLILDFLSFRNKLEVIKKYNNISKKFIDSLVKVNKYRNEFAHPKADKLKNKYDKNTLEYKENIRNLLRCLNHANDEMNKYFDNIAKSK